VVRAPQSHFTVFIFQTSHKLPMFAASKTRERVRNSQSLAPAAQHMPAKNAANPGGTGKA
jgi:hypothetical protein